MKKRVQAGSVVAHVGRCVALVSLLVALVGGLKDGLSLLVMAQLGRLPGLDGLLARVQRRLSCVSVVLTHIGSAWTIGPR